MRAITYGTFDFCHDGHIKLFQRIKERCDFVIVGLSTDEFNEQKGKQSHFSYEERKESLYRTGLIDFVIPEFCWEQKVQDIISYNIDVFYMGSDWFGKFDFLKQYCDVVYLQRTPNISSSQLREQIKFKEDHYAL